MDNKIQQPHEIPARHLVPEVNKSVVDRLDDNSPNGTQKGKGISRKGLTHGKYRL
jgi:hypothetical protein